MSFFDSEIVREELEVINELQTDISKNFQLFLHYLSKKRMNTLKR